MKCQHLKYVTREFCERVLKLDPFDLTINEATYCEDCGMYIGQLKLIPLLKVKYVILSRKFGE
jgi:hypothetical protein